MVASDRRGEPPFFCPFEESLFPMARRAKDPEKRIQSLEARLEKDPASPAFFPLAHLLLAKERDARAEGLLRQGLETFPAYAAARVLLGKILHSKGLFEDAVIVLEAAAGLSPWNIEAQRLLADSYLNSGDEAGAQRARAIVGMFDPLSEEGRAAFGVAPAPAAPAAKADRGKEETPAGEAEAVPTLSLAELYTSQGHLDKAAGVYRRLLEEDPGNDDLGEKLSAVEAQIGEGAAPAAAEGGEGAAVELPELDEDLGADLEELMAGAEAEAPPPPPAPVEEEAGAESEDLDLSMLDLDAEGEEAGLDLPEAEAPPAPVEGAEAPAAAEGEDLDLSMLDLDAEGEELGPESAVAEAAPAAAEGGEEVAVELPELDEDLGADLEELMAGAEAEAPPPPPAPVEDAEAPPAPVEEEAGAESEDLDLSMLDLDGEGEELGPESAVPGAAGAAPAAAEGGEGAAVELPELDEDLGADLEELMAGEEAEAPPAPVERVEAPAAPAEEAAGAESEDLDLSMLDLDAEEEELGPESAVAGAADAAAEGGLDEDIGAGFEMLTDEEETPPAEGAGPGEEPRDPIQEEFLSEELEEVSPGEGAGESVEVVQPETGIDSTLEGLVQLYVDEGNFEHALDLCRKSAILGGESPTLTALIRGLEQKLAEDRASVPGAAPSDSVSSQDVVVHLEKWLRTLRNRKAEPSANEG